MLSGFDAYKIRREMQRILRADGQTLHVVKITKSACPDCGGIDPYDNSPYDSNCPTCGGTGFFTSETRYPITAIQQWMSQTSLTPWIAGSIVEGDVSLRIRPEDRALVESIQGTGYILVNGVHVTPTNITPVTLADQVLEYHVVCKRTSSYA